MVAILFWPQCDIWKNLSPGACTLCLGTTLIQHTEAETNCRHFADGIFKFIFLNENVWISFKISLKFVPKVWNNNILALLQIMVWHCPGDRPLSEPMMVSLLMHVCVTQPQWVNYECYASYIGWLRDGSVWDSNYIIQYIYIIYVMFVHLKYISERQYYTYLRTTHASVFPRSSVAQWLIL